MKFLSTRRRHPLAGLVVLLLGLVVMGGLYSAFRPAAADQSAQRHRADLAGPTALRRLVRDVPRARTARASSRKQNTNFGPPLIGVGAAAVDFQVGTGTDADGPAGAAGAAADARSSTQAEVRALAAYVASLGPGPAIPSADEYSTAGLTAEQIAEGGEFFRTNCTACHNFAGTAARCLTGKYAPCLHRGRPASTSIEAMLTGPQQMPKFSNAVLKPQEKREIIAYLQHAEEPARATADRSSAASGPVTEGLWGWVLGIGVLVLATVWISNNGARAKKKKSQ